MPILFRPPDRIAGDFIPFYWEGDYHLFYLTNHPERPGLRWWHLVTRDFLTFDDRGEAIPLGDPAGLDAEAWTGSVVAGEGRFHLFYTGANPRLPPEGRMSQVVLHASSSDLDHWSREPEPVILPPSGYEQADWRDPFVFPNDQAGEYWMLVGGRRDEGPVRQRGCTALLASSDLMHWELRPPLWAPDLYHMHECPDLFRLGDWWYLVFSEFSDRFATRYRMSRSSQGPWLAPPEDAFDARAYYAAKTAGPAAQRHLFGWLPLREGDKDDGGWTWGGSLVVHRLTQAADGTLGVCLPEPIAGAFGQRLALSLQPVLGDWQGHPGHLHTEATGRGNVALLGGLPETCLVQAEITFTPGTAACGLLLRADGALGHYYQLRLEPARQRLVVDRWPRPGDQPFMAERPLTLAPGHPVRLQVLVDGTALVAYANDRVALSWRMYDHREGALGAFVSEGGADFALQARAMGS